MSEEILRALMQLFAIIAKQDEGVEITQVEYVKNFLQQQLSDEEVKEYYDQNQSEFVRPTEWRLREIMVETEDEAKGILVELYQGADFIEMVKRSKSKSSWEKGDLGFKATSDFPKIQDVAEALDVGGMSGVFAGPEGYYIIKL